MEGRDEHYMSSNALCALQCQKYGGRCSAGKRNKNIGFSKPFQRVYDRYSIDPKDYTILKRRFADTY